MFWLIAKWCQAGTTVASRCCWASSFVYSTWQSLCRNNDLHRLSLSTFI